MPSCTLRYVDTHENKVDKCISIPGEKILQELRVAAVKNFDLDPDEFDIRTESGDKITRFTKDIPLEGQCFTVSAKGSSVSQKAQDLASDVQHFEENQKKYITNELHE